MSSESKNPQHWPFSDGSSDKDTDASFRAALDGKRARESALAADRRNVRNNRLIVGGRAHNKKHGLS